MLANDRFMVILIEKSDLIILIDATEQFERLGIFSTWPKHGFKLLEED
jgi:hypothetical protein